MKYSKKQIEELTFKFEEKYGEGLLAKCGLSALNRLLVKKGVITEEELIESLVKRIAEYAIDLKEIDKSKTK